MRSIPQHPRLVHATHRQHGFALLITVTLLAFLVLILVSLATLTRVETQVAANSQQLSQARQNALFALNLALGQLQRFAGPDQRATAAADLGDGGTPTADNKLVTPKPGARHWTGVWGNRAAWDADATAPGLLNWLVSGNEAVTVTADTGVGSFGQITSPVPSPAFAPDGDLPSLSAATTTTTDLGDWCLLVGPGTVGKADPTRYVVAPVSDIKVGASTLPGFDSGAPDQVVGRFAWWVGDEGVKASTTLVDPLATRSDASERRYSFITAQRVGVERLVADYPANTGKLADVLTFPQLPLAATTPAAQTGLRDAVRDHFHDLTGLAVSLLTDSSRGGLKKDLTAWLDHGGGPADSDPIVPGTGSDTGMPRWGLIRTYAAIVDDGTTHPAISPGPEQQSLNPVVTYLRLGYDISVLGGKLSVHLYPAVVLWNPSNVPIEDEYEVALGYRNDIPRITFTVLDSTGTPVPGKTVDFRPHYGGDDVTTGATPAGSRSFRFKIGKTTLPPGRSQMFALQTADQPYTAGQNILTPLTAGSPELLNSAVLASTVSLDPGEQVRWDNLTAGTNGWRAGNFNLTLRVPSTTPLSANYDDAQPGDYQVVRYAGFSTGTPITIPATGTPLPTSLNPVLSNNLRLMMGNSTLGFVALRWTAHANPRAWQSFRTGLDLGAANPNFAPGVQSGAAVGTPTTKDGQSSAGLTVDVKDNTPVDLVLSEFRPVGVPLFSLAQLQHANLSPLAMNPAYAVGNALCHPYFHRDEHTVATTSSGSALTLHDLSWHLNRALWDRYYFSTVPKDIDQDQIDRTTNPEWRLPNARLDSRRSATPPPAATFKIATAFSTNASHLAVHGGFNVNSASPDAWRAMLASLHSVAYDPQNPSSSTSPLTGDTLYPIPRYINPIGGPGGTWQPNDPWAGYRALTGNAIDGLAGKIVEEVRKRGPFLSLADFVNRRIVADDTGYKGTLQAAIDSYDTTQPDNAADAINRRGDFLDNEGPATPLRSDYQEEYWSGPARQMPHASPAAFAPGYLTQADLLTMLGPVLSARSDTFTIRAYGEVLNPVTGDIAGRAWCEATVQRLPSFVNPDADAPDTWPPADSGNQSFGRRFSVVSFRWLSPQEI